MKADGVRAYKLLIEAGVSLDRFAELSGVKVGSVARLRRLDKGMWEVVGRYDRRSRLLDEK